MSKIQSKVPYQAVPADVEGGFAKAPPPPQTIRVSVSALRPWYKHWCCCFGECDGLGWGSCLLGYFCPFVAFGLNKQRAFRQSAILWALLFFILYVLNFTYCPVEMEGSDSDEIDTTISRTRYTELRVHEETTRQRQDFICYGILSLLFSNKVAIGVSAAVGVLIIVLGTMNRTALRNKFGLEGNIVTDCLLWAFCTPCVLCQETRTLWHNSVEDGVWHGPPQVFEIPVIQGASGLSGTYVIGQQVGQEPAAPVIVALGTAAPPAQQSVDTEDLKSGQPPAVPKV